MLTKKRKLGYASGIVSESVLYNMFYTYFLVFLTDIVGINPALAGTISMVSIIWDGITDPLIGHATDKKSIDKRKIMKASIIPMAIFFIFAFTSFNFLASYKVIYYLISAVLFWIAYTKYTIPYYAICAEITADYDERTNIRGLSSFINAFAIFIGAAAPVVLVEAFCSLGTTVNIGWTLSAIIVAIIAVIFGIIAYNSTKNLTLIKSEKADDQNVFSTYLEILKIKPFKYLLVFVVLFMVQNALGQANLMYLISHRLHADADAYMPIALGSIVLGMVLFVPLTTKLSTIRDRRFAVIVLLSISTLGMASFRIFGITNVVSLVVMLLFYALGLAVFWTTFYSFTYDIAEIDEMKNNRRRVGAITSLPQFLQKVGAAIGMQILGLVLYFYGYDANLPVQTFKTSLGIESIITVICPIVMGLSVVFMILYPITKKKYHILQTELEKKRNKEPYDTSSISDLL